MLLIAFIIEITLVLTYIVLQTPIIEQISFAEFKLFANEKKILSIS